MARYVIDAPTLLRLIEPDVEVDPSHQLVAPNSIRSEALQLLLDQVRSGTRSDADASEAHERMTGMKLRLLGDRVSRGTAWRIARDHDIPSLRDAEYLAITRLQADAFVTVDADTARRAAGIVATASFESLLT
jgi:predicted nucleic acid-binding protein